MSRVRDILEKVVKEEPSFLPQEPLTIYVSDFKESCVEMGIRYWVKTEEYWESRWRVLENIKEAFDKNNICIPFNQLDVNIMPVKEKNTEEA